MKIAIAVAIVLACFSNRASAHETDLYAYAHEVVRVTENHCEVFNQQAVPVTLKKFLDDSTIKDHFKSRVLDFIFRRCASVPGYEYQHTCRGEDK